MKRFFTVLFFLGAVKTSVRGQELYVSSEPASNMPAKSMSLRLTAKYPQSAGKQRYMPEVMFGINKNWMAHVSTTLSNYYTDKLRFEGGKVYAKYRFYSKDGVHKHFRMAAFADIALSSNPYFYEEVTLEGDNNGVQVGLIATQLINKLAVSGTLSYTKVLKNNSDYHHTGMSYNMANYSLSAGYLLFPKEYTNYQQTNLNLYLEMLGMRSLDQKHFAVDLAPAVQLIFNSNTKLNLGYRFQVSGNMTRVANKTFLVGLEHTLFNIWK